jgi:hypothetical protein
VTGDWKEIEWLEFLSKQVNTGKVLVFFLAAAAAKTVSVFIQAGSGYPKAMLVKSFGHSVSS